MRSWGSSDAESQPVAYASRALTSAQTRYAQIKKELLAIVFGCDHFEAYIYGRDRVQVETDHKPLVSIVLTQQAPEDVAQDTKV